MVQTVQASKGQNNDLLSSLANNLSSSSTSFASVLNEIRASNTASADSKNIDRSKKVGNNFQQVKKVEQARPLKNASKSFKAHSSKPSLTSPAKKDNNGDNAEVMQASANAMQAAEPVKVNAKSVVEGKEVEEDIKREVKNSNDIEEVNNGIKTEEAASQMKEANSEDIKVPPFMEVIELLKSAMNYQNKNVEEVKAEGEVSSNTYIDNNIMKLAGLLDSLDLTEAESVELSGIISEIEMLPDESLAKIKEVISKMNESGKVELSANSQEVEEVEVETDKSELVEALSIENNKSSNQILGNIDSSKTEVQNIVNKFIVFLGSVKALESANSSEAVVNEANTDILESISSKEVVEANTLPKANIATEGFERIEAVTEDIASSIALNEDGKGIVKNVLDFIESIQVSEIENEIMPIEVLPADIDYIQPSSEMPNDISSADLLETGNNFRENISSQDRSTATFVKAEAVKEVADIVKNVVQDLEESVETLDVIASEEVKETESTEKYQNKAESKSAEVSTKAQAPITSEALKKDFKLSSVEVQDNRAERVEEADAKSVTVQGKDSSSLNSSLNNGSNNGANMQQAANNQPTSGSQNSFNTENVIKTDFNSLLKATNEVQVKEAALQKEAQATYNLQSSRDIEKLTKLIESSVSKAEAVLKVRLTPENLGKLQIELTEQGGKVSAKILADNENSHKLIMSQSELLKNQLAEKGIVIDSMEFAFNDAKSKEDNAFAKSNRNGKQSKNGKGNETESNEEIGTDIANNKSDRLYA